MEPQGGINVQIFNRAFKKTPHNPQLEKATRQIAALECRLAEAQVQIDDLHFELKEKDKRIDGLQTIIKNQKDDILNLRKVRSTKKKKRSEKMISEEDKKEILNGAYGISRDGVKCKYVGLSDYENYPYVFIYFNDSNEIVRTLQLSEEFHNIIDTVSVTDIVGLWKDLPEPFNLEKALQGEPVMLRNGLKAYIKYTAPSEYTGEYPLKGYIIDPDSSEGITSESWTLAGKEFTLGVEYDGDIIGMWKEPEPVSNTVTVTLPKPLTEPKDEMWFIRLDGYTKSSYGKNIPLDRLKLRYYFGSEADAQAWLDAIQNSRR